MVNHHHMPPALIRFNLYPSHLLVLALSSKISAARGLIKSPNAPAPLTLGSCDILCTFTVAPVTSSVTLNTVRSS